MPGDGDAEDEGKGREWPVMSVVADESGAKRVALDRMRLRDGRVGPLPADATTVDLVLRANKRLAEQSGQARIWDGEIVLRDVPLEMAGRGAAKGGSRRPTPSNTGRGGPV
jgi:hypothetical protein